MSSRSCPDWPQLMEIAPELQFKHYTVREAQLPPEALVNVPTALFDEVDICCDLESHVYNAEHTDPRVTEVLRATHWFDLRDWVAEERGEELLPPSAELPDIQ